MAGRLFIGPKSNSSTKHVVPTPPFPLRTTPTFPVDMDAHFPSITGPSTPVRTRRRVQGAVLDAVALHVLLGDAFHSTKVRALHVALRAVESLMQPPTRFGAYALTTPHAGPRTDVLLVVLAFLKRYFQPAAQATADGSP